MKLSDEEIDKVIEYNNDKMMLTDKQKEIWYKKRLCFVESKDVVA